MERVECVVIGAGVVGLAVARALALAGREVVLVEAAEAIGTGTSSRSSEVIHAGIYYPAGSLKARLCVAGREALYRYAAERQLPHRRCGKLIVATEPDQLPALEALHRRGTANGVEGLDLLDAAAARALEPALACRAALISPDSGIIDSHALMLSLQGDAEAAGAAVALCCPVLGGAVGEDGIVLATGGAEPMRLAADIVVNSAGLAAGTVAAGLRGLPPASIPRQRYAKGSYYALRGRAPFSRLVYPLPVDGGLGIHLTLDLAGQARFGPDVEWVERPDYDVDPGRAEAFYAAIRRYWPGLADGALGPGYAGVRPKLQANGGAADFVIQGPRDHGVPGLVNLYGIESPGLTASFALADAVVELLLRT